MNSNPFGVDTDSLMTIEEVSDKAPKVKKKQDGYDIIIKKVQKEPQKIDKIIFKELYKYYVSHYNLILAQSKNAEEIAECQNLETEVCWQNS